MKIVNINVYKLNRLNLLNVLNGTTLYKCIESIIPFYMPTWYHIYKTGRVIMEK